MRTHVTDATVEDEHGNQKQLIVITVAPSDHLHRAGDETTYLRAGDSTLKLNYVQERELMFDRSDTTFESEAAATHVLCGKSI